jgi:glycosyltransferase involved in cell wall biosynthesis
LSQATDPYTPAVRLLVIAFFFPPAGGGGVQRTLKFCKFLPELGVDVHVLAPSDPKWLATDQPLVDAIPAATHVHRAPFLGPRASRPGERVAGVPGWRRAADAARRASTRLLIPDKAAPWSATAVPAAIRIVRRDRIDAIMTTSPPHSAHLIGAAVAAATGKPWVADFRDSWLANPHRRYEGPVRAKRSLERRMAITVVRRADALVAVTDAIAGELEQLGPRCGRPQVIANGVDFEDFDALGHTPNERFTLVHAGSFFGHRTPRPLLTAVHDLLGRRPDLAGRIRVRFVGDLRETDRVWARTLDIADAWQETGFLPYQRSVAEQRGADALALLIPHAGGRGDSVLSGKVFEYLAARRPVLAAVPPNGIAADLIRRLGAGRIVDPEDVPGMAAELERLVDAWADGGLPDLELPPGERSALSRRARAAELAALLTRMAAA